MATRDSLQVVLGLRRQKEDAEERRLTEILREKAELQEQIERIVAELQQITALRLLQMEQVQNGLSYQESDTAMTNLSQWRADILARIRELEGRRVQQICLYAVARKEREVIEEVQGKREALRERASRVREQKRIEELFLARRVRDSDTFGV